MSHSTAKPVPPLAASRRTLLLASLGVVAAMAGCGGNNEEDIATAAGSPAPVPAPGPSSGSGGAAPGPVSSPAPTPGPAPNPSPAPAEWNVNALFFTAGTNSSLDLSATLPNGVQRGGTFGVSADGEALPAGMTLSPVGILSVGSAGVGSVAGVVFTYAEPS